MSREHREEIGGPEPTIDSALTPKAQYFKPGVTEKQQVCKVAPGLVY